MDITFAKPSSPSVGGLAVIASENSGLAGTAAILDKKMKDYAIKLEFEEAIYWRYFIFH